MVATAPSGTSPPVAALKMGRVPRRSGSKRTSSGARTRTRHRAVAARAPRPPSTPSSAAASWASTSLRRQPDPGGAARRPPASCISGAGSLTPLCRSTSPSTFSIGAAIVSAYASQRVQVVAEELDLHRAGAPGQVVDHVGEDLHELDARAAGAATRSSRAPRRSPPPSCASAGSAPSAAPRCRPCSARWRRGPSRRRCGARSPRPRASRIRISSAMCSCRSVSSRAVPPGVK